MRLCRHDAEQQASLWQSAWQSVIHFAEHIALHIGSGLLRWVEPRKLQLEQDNTAA